MKSGNKIQVKIMNLNEPSLLIGVSIISEMPKTECREIISELTKYGKKLWIDTCLEQSEDGESEQEIREESEYLFDYIFENHDYPE